MNYYFKRITINNFKYISSNKPCSFDFESKSLILLNGQNGYGKTTLFDAIELFLIGKIKHFNDGLLNRGTQTLSILAHDDKKDIVISAELINTNKESIYIQRVLTNESNYKSSTIICENQVIEQKELEKLLGFTQDYFNLGMYISQSESLDFLKNKYSDRKNAVNSLVDLSSINFKADCIKEIKESLHQKIINETDKINDERVQLEKEIKDLENNINKINDNMELPNKDIRLFPEENYAFDIINFDENVSYETLISPLKELEGFIEKYNAFCAHVKNKEVEQILKQNEQLFKALFYKKSIEYLKQNSDKLVMLNNVKKLQNDIDNNVWSENYDVLSFVGVKEETIEQIQYLLKVKKDKGEQLNESSKVLASIKSSRDLLIQKFHNATELNVLSDNKCPLCGSEYTNLNEMFHSTSEFISHISEEDTKYLNELEEKLSVIYNGIKLNVLEILNSNQILFAIDQELNNYKHIDTTKLEHMLAKENINDFSSKTVDKFSLQEFKDRFKELKDLLKSKLLPVDVVLTQEEIVKYKQYHEKYYKGQTPTHTLDDLYLKERYIAHKYCDKTFSIIESKKVKLNKLIQYIKTFNERSNALENIVFKLCTRYGNEKKEYQTQLANAIRLPLMIYSGKIIQNYPLGLGIKVSVEKNALKFETLEKSDVDVYNILSTGQLNGLAISFLLSIRSVYRNENGLDLLMIDDPLQTIDDISAISLADLLSTYKNNQTILSTHEDSKAELFKYKFQQMNQTVKAENMRDFYMKAVMD